MAGLSTVTLKGEKELLRKLEKLKGSRQRRATRGAARAALSPINKAAKRNAPRRLGLVRKSIGIRMKTFSKANVVWGRVGPRSESKYGRRVGDRTERPHRYAHIVEFGSERMPARPFIGRAWASKRTEAEAIFVRKLREGIDREARRP